MSRILFVTWDGGGNLAPALGIAGALVRRRHVVEFLGHEGQKDAVRAGGLRFHPFRHAVAWSPTSPADNGPGPPPVISVFTDNGPGLDLGEFVAHNTPDLVVIDHLLWGALRAAEDHQLQHATLVHTFFGQQRDRWSRGPGAELAGRMSYAPVEMWLRSPLVVIVTLPELDPAGVEQLPDNVRYTGPVWQGHPAPAIPEPEPLVLVSLSTLPQAGQAEVLQTVLNGLAGMPLHAVVTTGPSVDPTCLNTPDNAEVHGFASHAELMARASLVISHGGHATAMAALARDLPLLLIPMFPLGDQPAIARALEAKGAAIALDRQSSAGQVRGSVERLLVDPAYRRAAARLGELIRRRDGAEEAADCLTEAFRLPAPSLGGVSQSVQRDRI